MNESDPIAQAMQSVLPVNFKGIPQELRELRQIVLWKYDLSERGQAAKVPYGVRTGKKIDPLNSGTWVYLDEAQERYENEYGYWAGVGLALVSTVIAIDFDGVYQNGSVITPYANFVKHLNTYFEVSPSGRGLRGFLRGRSGERTRGFRNGWHIEVYDRMRYVSITGNHLASTPKTIDRNQPKFDLWYNYLNPPKEEKKKEIYIPTDDVNEIIRKAENARNGAKFSAFFRGDWKSAGSYPSKSESDLAFAMMICYWVKGDASKIDQIFRMSGMADEKWSRRTGSSTYGEITIKKAIELCRY